MAGKVMVKVGNINDKGQTIADNQTKKEASLLGSLEVVKNVGNANENSSGYIQAAAVDLILVTVKGTSKTKEVFETVKNPNLTKVFQAFEETESLKSIVVASAVKRTTKEVVFNDFKITLGN